MRRDQLEHAIRTACQIIDHSEVIVVGSQSILGTYDERELPVNSHPSCSSTASASTGLISTRPSCLTGGVTVWSRYARRECCPRRR